VVGECVRGVIAPSIDMNIKKLCESVIIRTCVASEEVNMSLERSSHSLPLL
jgi:hypothetical protein